MRQASLRLLPHVLVTEPGDLWTVHETTCASAAHISSPMPAVSRGNRMEGKQGRQIVHGRNCLIVEAEGHCSPFEGTARERVQQPLSLQGGCKHHTKP